MFWDNAVTAGGPPSADWAVLLGRTVFLAWPDALNGQETDGVAPERGPGHV